MGEEAAKEGDQSVEKEPKNSAFTKKIIKLMTVAAYMSGVSGAGVLLSLYYIIFWDPRITGVRPPGYLRSGERMGLPEAQAQMAPLPEAYNGKHQIPFPHKMSRQFMEAYLSNYTEDAADRVLGMMDGDPTPKVLPVAGEDSPALPTQTPPEPALHQPPNLQGDSSPSSPQRHHNAAALQHRQERHPQRPRHPQGDPLTPAA